MALAERATLIAELRLDDKMSRGLRSATGSLASFSKRAGLSSKNLQTLGTNLARIGAIAAAGIGAAVVSGISTLADLEDANTATAGALKATGLAAKISADQIRTWSEELETASDALVDDKAIQRAANTLIRFGDVTEESLRQAMEVATDLAPRFGTVEAAAEALAKSLVDPTTATRILKQAGVALTAAEKKKIKALVESGKVHEAQAIILDKLTEKTKGAAAAAAGPYRDSLNLLQDAAEDAKKALGEGFLPVIAKVEDKLKTAVADRKVMAGIREFGQSLAKGLDSLLSIAEKLPWGTIGDSMKIAGAGARTLLEAFTKLPPWVQTAVVTGWGLNKLTGGALSGIVGELGKGLVRGVLGMNAGVVNARAGVVNVVGGAGVGAGAAGAAGATGRGKLGSVAGAIGKVFMVGMAASAAVALAGALGEQSTAIREQGEGLVESAKTAMNIEGIRNAIAEINRKTDPKSWDNLALDITNGFNGGKDALLDTRDVLVDRLIEIEGWGHASDTSLGQIITAAATTNSKIGFLANTTATKGDATAGAVRQNTALLRDKDFSPKITVPVYIRTTVTVRQLQTATVTNTRYSPGGQIL